MTDSVLDDPGELIRFWLWHEYRHTIRSFKLPNLAKALSTKPGTVQAWLTRHAIPSFYWNPIARFFSKSGYRLLEEEARVLWQEKEHRRGYVPLRQLQKKRRDLVTMTTAASAFQRELPETPELVGGFLRQSDAAKRRRRRPQPARPAIARKTHGKRPNA